MWDMNAFNVSGALNIFRVLAKPSLCLPQATISTFNDLPIPLNKAFAKYGNVDIKVVVLDKDDCFAVPHTNEIYKPYEEHFSRLRQHYPGARLLIVSNTAGAASVDPSRSQAESLSTSTGVHVLQHRHKKPGCSAEIMDYLRSQKETINVRPEQVAVVGDRLMTDAVMANVMGAYGVWVKDGVVSRDRKSVWDCAVVRSSSSEITV
ncbi:MAG: hypothetical protein M1818_001712 [Claussenomyces sp. TS43310]|nr:MAG: hypothetical protein M1818_001712 [Claussenomyces sp. TS43310]